jgi:hypothetical protein
MKDRGKLRVSPRWLPYFRLRFGCVLVAVENHWHLKDSAAEWEVLQVNDLADEVHATPALGEGRIYVRTRSALYCFGTSP